MVTVHRFGWVEPQIDRRAAPVHRAVMTTAPIPPEVSRTVDAEGLSPASPRLGRCRNRPKASGWTKVEP